jgi:hypothetical protein
MNRVLRFTLLADGSSDRCLARIIEWILAGLVESGTAIDRNIADFFFRRRKPRRLADRMSAALEDYPCDILFVHRDAEALSLETRTNEIDTAASTVSLRHHVPVVPVRMTEAWLLFDVVAVRRAADNPNGRQPIDIPELRRLERVPDPKSVLESALRRAANKRGRDLERFNRDLSKRVHRVAELIDDFSPLRSLSAFVQFEARTSQAVAAWASVSAS